MQSIWKEILTAFLMGAVVPGVMLNAAGMILEDIPPETGVVVALEQVRPGWTMKVRREDGGVEERDLDEYLVGVVLAEMPASFEGEALKAQAVAARTYTRKAWETGGKHGDGSVCTDPACCQAFCARENFLSQGGTMTDIGKVRTAVGATRGQVLTYEGELIEATYFSSAGGSTEEAAAVWGAEFPYLQAVPSPETGREAQVFFTPEEFAAALDAELTGSPETWFGEVRYTAGGGVKTMVIVGRTYPGTRLRSLLGLRSTDFTVEPGKEGITITTRGYGHRVGMSQYGADAMAAAGSTYDEILAHYYPGTQLESLETRSQ